MHLGPEEDEDAEEEAAAMAETQNVNEDEDDGKMPYTVPRRDRAKEATIILNTDDVDLPLEQPLEEEREDILISRPTDSTKRKAVEPPTQDEYLWAWKVRLFWLTLQTGTDFVILSRSWRLAGKPFSSSVRPLYYVLM